jgi:hypothetical protein
MTTYIRRSYPAKKLAILGKRENEIMHAIYSGFSNERLFKAAEKVRAAQLAVLKGKRHYVVDDGNPHFDGFKEVDAKTAEWTSKPVEEIVRYYREAPKDSQLPPPPFAST